MMDANHEYKQEKNISSKLHAAISSRKNYIV